MGIIRIINDLDVARRKAQAVIAEKLREVQGDTNHKLVEKTTELQMYAKKHLRDLMAKLTADEVAPPANMGVKILELAPGVTTKLLWIPSGKFLMGSLTNEYGQLENEESQHSVTLTQGFWLADAPCTQAEWQAVMGTAPSHFKGANRPVENVSWEECKRYCQKMRALFPGIQARLPTEAEWEYACRAGTASAFNDGSPCTVPEGNDLALAKLGWFDENSDGETHDVRGKQANMWGLYDMHGNVWEWCEDRWRSSYDEGEQVDPAGPAEGFERVYRGGSWCSQARFCCSAYRAGRHLAVRYKCLGFRLAASGEQ